MGTKTSTRSPIQRSKISNEFASLVHGGHMVGCSTMRFIAFESFLCSPMKGKDFLFSDILEKQKKEYMKI